MTARYSLHNNLDLVDKKNFALAIGYMYELGTKKMSSHGRFISLTYVCSTQIVITEGVGRSVWLSDGCHKYLRDLRTETCSSQLCWTKKYLKIIIRILYNY